MCLVPDIKGSDLGRELATIVHDLKNYWPSGRLPSKLPPAITHNHLQLIANRHARDFVWSQGWGTTYYEPNFVRMDHAISPAFQTSLNASKRSLNVPPKEFSQSLNFRLATLEWFYLDLPSFLRRVTTSTYALVNNSDVPAEQVTRYKYSATESCTLYHVPTTYTQLQVRRIKRDSCQRDSGNHPRPVPYHSEHRERELSSSTKLQSAHPSPQTREGHEVGLTKRQCPVDPDMRATKNHGLVSSPTSHHPTYQRCPTSSI